MKKGRILIIDDETVILESLGMFLTEKGYEVRCALSMAEGLEKIDGFKPDAVILDIRLPDGDGLDLLKKLKSRNEEAAVIMITAFHDMDTTIRAIKLGATEYITKPIDVDELEKAVLRAMRLSGGLAGEPAPARPCRRLQKRHDRREQQGDKGDIQGHRRPFRKPRHRSHRRRDGDRQGVDREGHPLQQPL